MSYDWDSSLPFFNLYPNLTFPYEDEANYNDETQCQELTGRNDHLDLRRPFYVDAVNEDENC